MNCKTRVLAVLIAATAAPFAMAFDGTINFNGELKAQTCVINVNGSVSPTAATVVLPTVSTSALATAGQVTGQTGFNIQLSKCSGTAKTAAAFFESGSSVDPTSGNLKNTTGSATLVQLQLVDSANGKAIKAGDSAQVASTSRTSIDGSGNANLPYAVQYYANGATTAGTVVSSVTYSINYQ